MSTTPQPATATPSLEQFVRDDVIDALMSEGFTQAQAESGVSFGCGVTFSELFKTSLNWLMSQRRNGRAIPAPRKEAPVQTQTETVKPNGHAPVAQPSEKKCSGFKRECGEILGALNRTGLCTTCYARKKYHDAQSKNGMTSKPRKAAKRAVADRVEILDPAPPRCRPRLARSNRSATQSISREALACRQAEARQSLSANRG